MRRVMVLALAVGVALVGYGCQKKVTKVETPAPAPAPPPPPPPEPKPLPDTTTFQPVDMDALLQEAFKTVYFDLDKYDLKPEAVERLQIIGRFLADHATVRALAEGHCDESGSAEYNMGLGERRSNAVKDFLTAYGVSANRIETTSYGKERLAFRNCTDPECNARNRRVEWKILAK